MTQLQLTLALIAALGPVVAAAGAAEPRASAKGAAAAEALGWRLGAQAYTFRRFTFFEAVDRIAALGLHYVEMYPGQRISRDIPGKTSHRMSPQVMAKVQAKLKAADVKLVSYGVTGLPADEAACRQVFQWAKKMGVETIVSEPDPKHMPMIDRLCKEFDLRMAIHNHPKPSRYWDAQTVLDACRGLSNRVGACADTGHWARSGLDPLACLRKLKGRIISFHLKDLARRDRRSHDVPWGTGACDAAGMLAEMHRQGFRGVFLIEYESGCEHETLARCVSFFYSQAEKLAGTTRDEGWRPLLKPDLSNAICAEGAWVFQDGVLRPKGKGSIWTQQQYGDFVLDLEFKLAPKSNSGVFLRCGSIRNWLHTAIEVQVLDSHGKKTDKHCCGAVYDCLAPSKQMVKEPGEWNHMVITCRANRIQVALNGEPIIDMDLNRWTTAHRNPDGTRNKFNAAYKDMPRRGHIGFQYHGSPIEYRNVRIRTLKGPGHTEKEKGKTDE